MNTSGGPAAGGSPGERSLPAGGQELLELLGTLPYPALWLDSRLVIIDANDAFVGFCGYPRRALRGVDLLALNPPEDRPAERELRQALMQALAGGGAIALTDRRLLDANGRERWYRATLTPLGGAGLVSMLQDTTAEHAARAQADRSLNELAQWFDLSPSGMLVFDAQGLIVRSNRAFDALIGRPPLGLPDADPELQALLGWHAGAPHPELRPGAVPLERHVSLTSAGGVGRRLSARLSAFATEQGQRRFMAVVQDHSAEEERDLAKLEIGALMDTAGIGVATYDSARGWLRAALPADRSERAEPPIGGITALQGIAREMVEADSRADYERLQAALRAGQRAEVRYAVRHPELGQRWLLTRVEPGALGGGRRATTVVTLDVTDRERAQLRNEQLLRELSTIMDGSTAGVAYLRGAVLVRCNRRFERMLDMPAGSAAGVSLEAMFALDAQGRQVARDAVATLLAGEDFEGELAHDGRDGHRWYTLQLRPAPSGGDEREAVAVLTDITRLKTQQAELESLLRDRELMFSLSAVGIVYQRGARIERANQAMAELTGYSAPELTALDAAELYPSARECVDFEQALRAGLRQHGRYVGERRLRRRDGQLRWVQVAARPVDAEQPEAGAVCSFVDVDERHRARESLQQQASRTRAILDSVLVGIVTVHRGGIDWMNRSARRMFGGELADFVGEPIGVVATAEDGHPLRRGDWLERLTEGQAETFECRLRGRDGREFWVVGNAVLTARDGADRQLTFALLDIDSRRRAEVDVAQARASLQQVIETAPLAIALLDGGSRRILQGNATAAAFLAAPPAGLSQALDEAGAEPQRHALQQPGQPGEGGDRGRWWDTRIVALDQGDESAPRLLLVASDVTEQRAADQARLEAAIAQREVLVKEVHHRIKNNLQGVAGLLQQFAARRPDVAPALGEAVSQVQAIAQVYGLQVGAAGPLRVSQVVAAIALSVQRTFGRRIDFDAGAGVDEFVLPEAESIPIALSINELLTNTVKHGSGDGVGCRVDVDAEGVKVTLRHPGRLPAGFDLARFPGGVSGLGLVRALLPRRSATLTLAADGADVVTQVVLRPPGVRRDPTAAASATMPAMAATKKGERT